MAGTKDSKLKLLYIADILSHKTDEEHYLSALDICDELAKLGIEAERKSIYKDIDILTNYGYDIIHTGSKKSGGYFLGERKFQVAEVRLLCDAVQAAKFISSKKTNELVKKIESYSSDYNLKKLRTQVYVENGGKTSNETVYYTISKLQEAIETNRKTVFKYTKRKITQQLRTQTETKTFTVSPYALIWSGDHYYLVCNNAKYDNLMNLRIDRITGVVIKNERARHFSEVSPYKTKFDSADYASHLFNMYSGEPRPMELICENDSLEMILDKFGEKAKIKKDDDSHFLLKTNAAMSDGLVAWLLQCGTQVKVKSPRDLAGFVAEKAAEVAKMYEAPSDNE